MALNIGDTVDNWNRLIHLYSEQDISRKSEQSTGEMAAIREPYSLDSLAVRES